MKDPIPPRTTPCGPDDLGESGSVLTVLTFQAFQLRSDHRYALHPVEAALQYHRDQTEIPGEEGHGGIDFEEAEAHYRAGAQGLRLSEIPQLPQQLRELSRLGPTDRSGRKALRKWAEDHVHVFDDGYFAYLHPVTGVLAHDLHDENVVRLPESDGLAVIDPYISLARRGTWAAMKLAEIGYPTPPDDPFP